MPTVETVVAAVRDAGLGLYLDIKELTPAGTTHLVRLLAAERMTNRTILASSNPQTVAELAWMCPAIPRAVLFAGRDEDPVRLARRARADFSSGLLDRLLPKAS